MGSTSVHIHDTTFDDRDLASIMMSQACPQKHKLQIVCFRLFIQCIFSIVQVHIIVKKRLNHKQQQKSVTIIIISHTHQNNLV